jgi:DNA-directed RNA polymerase specialized sigma24 family protein
MGKKAKKRVKNKGEHYVDNARFTEAVAEYVEEYKLAEEKGEQIPQMSNYIGECILKIATHLSRKANFVNYTYKEEMISDAVENCCNYITNFDIEKSKNAFAYITQICYYAFIRRITREKKQQKIKFKLIEEAGIPGLYDLFADKDSLHEKDPAKEIVDNIPLSQHDLEGLAEETRQKNKKKKKRGLENFM